ncbi:hypothetical protein AB1Y20_008871 [Prymnesium parvum]|uniref:Uncharacterized protein n=1 Tax=Prymnesium parvum TaxID=97485 RepID=A0AB34IUN7_PRYPA
MQSAWRPWKGGTLEKSKYPRTLYSRSLPMEAATPMLTQAIAAAQQHAPPAGGPDLLLGVRTAIRDLFGATREALLATPSDVVSRVGQQAKSLSDTGLLDDPGVMLAKKSTAADAVCRSP